MSNLNLWEEQSPDGLQPNVSNKPFAAKTTTGQRALYVICWIVSFVLLCIPMIIWVVRTKNSFIAEQNDVNEASSQIQVNQAKRFDTLNKLVEQVRSHYKFEKTVLDEVTSNRALKLTNDIEKDEQVISQVQKVVNVAFERYPDLKSSTIVMELMSTSTWLENEISSARRMYNALATNWNAKIMSFMPVIIAEKMQLKSMPVYAAAQKERQDVSMSSLSDF
ncbi:LemA family protein [Ureaplasma miroungigenitalium]|uniref:LemA family protein n=1 Tax=Ureaplasma miroungigenitalium TaxID=1042321 RepID=A0ABT3BME0_9BACT|nr:LemA family protein [Ureaplasma miroungigenitalium]MCV3728302.1 LemA family protein [Ureaplasma miroungigenitalium]MCV3734107.1 LemA family protein [Ureaplasma miroungigenitalium]